MPPEAKDPRGRVYRRVSPLPLPSPSDESWSYEPPMKKLSRRKAPGGSSAATTTASDNPAPSTFDLYNDERADLELESKEGKVFKVHMSFLAQDCTLIKDLLSLSPELPSHGLDKRARLSLPASNALITKMLDYLTSFPRASSGTIINSLADAHELYAVADYLGCELFVAEAKVAFGRYMSVVDLLIWASQHDHDEVVIGMAFGKLGSNSHSPRDLSEHMAGWQSVPPLYLAYICAHTTIAYRQPWAWAHTSNAVKDFVKYIKEGEEEKEKEECTGKTSGV